MDVPGAVGKIVDAINRLLEAGELLELAPGVTPAQNPFTVEVWFSAEFENDIYALSYTPSGGLVATHNDSNIPLET